MMKYVLLMTTAIVMAVPAYAAEDSFGNRFGNSAPSALGDTIGDSTADTQGFGFDDFGDAAAFNAIDPAAGEEDAINDVITDLEDQSGEIDAQGNAIVSTDAHPEDADSAHHIDAEAGAEEAELSDDMAVTETETVIEEQSETDSTTEMEAEPESKVEADIDLETETEIQTDLNAGDDEIETLETSAEDEPAEL